MDGGLTATEARTSDGANRKVGSVTSFFNWLLIRLTGFP